LHFGLTSPRRERWTALAAYVRDHLAQLPDVNANDRAKLVDGAKQDLDTTLRHLVDHSCRLLLQSHFDEGASRDWILHMIELGQKPHEPSWWGDLLTVCLVAQHVFLNLTPRRQQREPDRQCIQRSYRILAARQKRHTTIFSRAAL
jgi:hypothetical protein